MEPSAQLGQAAVCAVSTTQPWVQTHFKRGRTKSNVCLSPPGDGKVEKLCVGLSWSCALFWAPMFPHAALFQSHADCLIPLISYEIMLIWGVDYSGTCEGLAFAVLGALWAQQKNKKKKEKSFCNDILNCQYWYCGLFLDDLELIFCILCVVICWFYFIYFLEG